mgnify:CR=1 FL=1
MGAAEYIEEVRGSVTELKNLRPSHKTLGRTGGGGDNDGMDPRIAVLEHRAEAADQRMARIEDKLDRLIEATTKLPSTNAMWTMVASVIGICAASVGVIVAILTWLQGFHH